MVELRFTADEMLESAREAGHEPSRRRMEDWVSLGLLAHATRRGLGRGRGIAATWSRGQRDLFLALLERRARGERIPALCNLPVSLWLSWGNDYLPTRQARAAFATWAGRERGNSKRAARATARQALADLESEPANPRERRRFLDAMTDAVYSQRFERDELLELARRVYRPGRSFYPFNVLSGESTPEAVVFRLETRLLALVSYDRATDATFENARLLGHESRLRLLAGGTPRDQPLAWAAWLRAQRTDGLPLGPPDLEPMLVERACLDLLTTLGMWLRALQSTPSNERKEERP